MSRVLHLGGRVFAAFVAVCLSLAAIPLSAQDPIVWNALQKAISASARQALARNGVTGEVADFTIDRMAELIAAKVTLYAGSNVATATWALLVADLLPEGANVSPGYTHGGGGVSGAWQDVCDIVWKKDAQGNLIIPAIPFFGSGPIKFGAVVYRNTLTIQGESFSTLYFADNPIGAHMYQIHRKNIARGDGRNYMGAWRPTPGSSTSYDYRGVSYFASNGSLVSAGTTQTQIGTDTWTAGQSGRVECPQGDGGATDTDFYAYGTSGAFSNCLYYIVNRTSDFPTGYAYPKETTVPANLIREFPNNVPHLAGCALSDEFIRRLTQAIMQQAAQQPGYNGATPVPVTLDDVRHDGDPPTVEDLGDSPIDGIPSDDPTSPTEPPPAPVDPDNPGDGSSGPVNVNWGSIPATPDPDLTPPDFGWWPTMPTITIATSTQCPTYSFDAWNQTFVLDSHCPFIEDNRALISALMLIMFTIAATRVVLGA